ncbi:hypothetical protein KRMM14A1259_21850 [Krasilnikovia sp. MM14-A1259]
MLLPAVPPVSAESFTGSVVGSSDKVSSWDVDVRHCRTKMCSIAKVRQFADAWCRTGGDWMVVLYLGGLVEYEHVQ